MAEYIERSSITDVLLNNTSLEGYDLEEAVNAICAIPAADVRPVVTCADCKHNNACLTQAFVEDESKVPFDRNIFFCADGKRADDA